MRARVFFSSGTLLLVVAGAWAYGHRAVPSVTPPVAPPVTAKVIVTRTVPAAAPALRPEPAELERVVRRFYADIAKGNAEGFADALRIVSPNYAADHPRNAFVDEYVNMREIAVRIDDVRGRSVDATVDYTYRGRSGVKLLWERRASWGLAHGSAGWVLDSERTLSDEIVTYVAPDGTRYAAKNNRVLADGRHVFNAGDNQYAFIARPTFAWRLAPLPRPKGPAPAGSGVMVTDAAGRPIAPASNDELPSTGDAAPERTHASVGTAGDCERQAIESVDAAGEIVALPKGRRYLVRASDRVLSANWAPTETITVCDLGPGQAVTLTRRDKTIYALHL